MIFNEFIGFISMIFHYPGLVALLVMFCCDVILGVIMACMRKSDHTLNGALESRQLLKGIYKKIGMILMLLVTCAISFFTTEVWIVDLTMIGLIAHEGFSILENMTLIGVPFPAKLKDMLEVMKKGGEKDNDGK